jgi:hypothetical protein
MPTELTAEQLSNAENMSLEELHQLAIAEVTGSSATTATTQTDDKPRDDKGRFVKAEEADAAITDEDEDDDEPTSFVVRQEIPNGEGSVDVYEGVGQNEAEAYRNLAANIATGKENANKKIRELSQKVKAQTAADQQTNEDIEYVIQEKLKKNPKQTIKEVVAETIAEQQAATQRSLQAQEQFVATHPDYIADPKNGNGERMMNEFRRLFPQATEFTTDGLEKAYQSLKASRLLALKAEGAGDATDANVNDTQPTAEDTTQTTQQRSQKRGSNITTRSHATTAARVNAQPTQDEAYAMPMEKLRELADAEVRKTFGGNR